MAAQAFSLIDRDGKTLIRFADGEVRSLGPREDVLVTFADHFGDDGVNAEPVPG